MREFHSQRRRFACTDKMYFPAVRTKEGMQSSMRQDWRVWCRSQLHQEMTPSLSRSHRIALRLPCLKRWGPPVGSLLVTSRSRNLSYWGIGEYESSWRDSLQVIFYGEEMDSCLISSITDPETSNFILCWPLYRRGRDVIIQNSTIFLDELRGDFNPLEP